MVKNTDKKETKKDEKKVVKKKDAKKKEVSKDVTPKGFKAFKLELKKVKWPTKKEMIKYTIATLVFVVFFGLFFYALITLMSMLKNAI